MLEMKQRLEMLISIVVVEVEVKGVKRRGLVVSNPVPQRVPVCWASRLSSSLGTSSPSAGLCTEAAGQKVPEGDIKTSHHHSLDLITTKLTWRLCCFLGGNNCSVFTQIRF